MTETIEITDRTTLRRKRERGNYDRDVVNAILDEGMLCHVGFPVEGATYVQPMAYARIDDMLYLHGAAANRMLRELATGVEACVTVTLVDGIVFARAAFHHSMNYRSVVLFGRGSRVTDHDELMAASIALLDHMAPGRSSDARLPSPADLRATLMVRFPIAEGSAKIRTGNPVDDEEDRDLPHWAGVLPFRLVAGEPITDTAGGVTPAVPGYLTNYPERHRP